MAAFLADFLQFQAHRAVLESSRQRRWAEGSRPSAGGASESDSELSQEADEEEISEGNLLFLLSWFAQEPRAAPWLRWLLRAESRGDRWQRSQGSPPRFPQGRHVTSPLLKAAGAGEAESIQVLIEASADLGFRDENDCTALHWAADKGHLEACKTLLAADAAVDAVDDDSWTPLCLAAEEGHLAVCRVLLDAGAKVNLPEEDLRSPLWWAAWKNHVELAKLLIQFRADLEQRDQWGFTPAQLLADEGKRRPKMLGSWPAMYRE
eukprot:s70_g8.t1